MNRLAIAMGKRVRVALGDNLWMDHGRADLATIGRAMGREPATPDQVRALPGIPLREPGGSWRR